jgi:hypothetical protein
MAGITLYTPQFIPNGTSSPSFNTVYTIATSTTDNSVTIPAQTNSGKMTDQSSWWYIVVATEPAYIAYNAVAVNTGTCALLPVSTGFPANPVRIPPGTVVHALASTGTGLVSFIPAQVSQ